MNADFPRIMTLIRKERKISQKQAAADLGISQALLSHYEKGIRECGLEFLVRAADYYDVSCDYLLGRSPLPKTGPLENQQSPQKNENLAMLSEAENVIMKICEKSDVVKNIPEYLNACLYKLVRMIYNSNPENDKNAFRISSLECEHLSDCIISAECAKIKKKCSKQEIKVIFSELSKLYSDSHSLLKIIKLTEDKIAAL